MQSLYLTNDELNVATLGCLSHEIEELEKNNKKNIIAIKSNLVETIDKIRQNSLQEMVLPSPLLPELDNMVSQTLDELHCLKLYTRMTNLQKTHDLITQVMEYNKCRKICTPKLECKKFIELCISGEYIKYLNIELQNRLRVECTKEFCLRRYDTLKLVIHKYGNLSEWIGTIAEAHANKLYKECNFWDSDKCITFLINWLSFLLNLQCISDIEPDLAVPDWIIHKEKFTAVGNPSLLLEPLRLIITRSSTHTKRKRIFALLNILLMVTKEISHVSLWRHLEIQAPPPLLVVPSPYGKNTNLESRRDLFIKLIA